MLNSRPIVPLIHYLQLSFTSGLGSITIARLIETLGSAENACSASVAQLQSIDGIGTSKARSIHQSLRSSQATAQDELKKVTDAGFSLFCPEDEIYPTLLREIPDPPAILYMKGNLEPRDLNAVAIVGSRKCSYYGREQAERFAALLAGAGFTVISGGARGIDSSAHRGAMQPSQGRTIAVLGSGLDVPYPPENASLFDQIANRGAILSEYPLGTPPVAENFPRRNRIVSGLSRGVLVIEADTRSGALITARQAADDHNRPVFAVPGRVDNPLSAGPHKLIRDGAVLTTNLEDIIESLGPLPQSATEPYSIPSPQLSEPVTQAPQSRDLSHRQKIILDNIEGDVLTVDALVERTALSAHEVLQELTFMSLKGLIKRVDGQTYKAPAR